VNGKRLNLLLPPTAAALMLAATPAAHATDHLVQEGTNWQFLAERLTPGDRIILMPGEHRPVSLSKLHGTAQRPITIMGVDPRNPSTIEAERYGIRIEDLSHLHIRNLIITGATIHGISLEAAWDPDADESALPYDARRTVRLSNITVKNTGPQGLRHAINLEHLSEIQIEDCRLEGWAGSGIELLGCTDVTIENSRFTGKQDHTQISGVRVRGGSDRVRITNCRFENVGDQGVCIGGESDLEELRPKPADDAQHGSLFEAARVQVMRCVFKGSMCALAFVNCERSTVRNCTIHRPRRAVVSIRREQKDPRFGAVRYCTFGSNLIVWQPGDVARLAHVGKDVQDQDIGIDLEDNLWWSPDLEQTKQKLGAMPGNVLFPQVMNVDPELDDELKPTEEQAKLFGAHAP